MRNYRNSCSYHKYALLFLFSTLVYGCKKNSAHIECKELPESVRTGWSFVSDGLQVQMPCFNPNNNDEFVFVKLVSSGNEVYTFNLTSKEFNLVSTTSATYPPDWGKSGWILLNPGDRAIRKIKSNGDSSTKITDGSIAYYGPVWNYSNNGILAHTYSSSVGILMNLNRTIRDTFPNCPMFKPVTYINDSLILASYEEIGLYSITSDRFQAIVPCDYPSSSGTAFINSDEFVWGDVSGMYTTNVKTRHTRMINMSCHSKYYLNQTVNKNKTKMLWTRVELEPTTAPELLVRRRIVMMNIDGSEEEEITFPF